MQDWKMTDKVAGVNTAGLENGGRENDGRKMNDWNLQDWKMTGLFMRHSQSHATRNKHANYK